MRRGETAKYVQQLRALPDLYTAFDLYAATLMERCACMLPCICHTKLCPSRRCFHVPILCV